MSPVKYASHFTGQGTFFPRGQRSEGRGQIAEIRGRKPDFGDQKSEKKRPETKSQ